MRIVDFDTDETLTDPDLTQGYLSEGIGLKEGAVAPDMVTKFAYADDDYEDVQFYHHVGEAVINDRSYEELQAKLRESDYIAAKALDGLLSVKSLSDLLSYFAEVKEKYGEALTNRETWREQIRELREKMTGASDTTTT